ncbi:E3 ubiquitin-protein ligase PUB23 [Apostasia shenzhenica]|uniref:U-box domain-containing protein n=1 Tax=Apostasia shenzhenica TaxID=1088818 RepID=A0A2I0AEN1_9ASPA|nr:E3 ubiquitin-protein ligase PUB23 [Apostasia shenzhenica]
MEELPSMFRCPISLQLMENPVTIATGVTYERRSIEKWLFTYKKTTCPATMQPLHNFDLIPNRTLKSLIDSWRSQSRRPTPPPSLPSSSSSSSPTVRAQLTSILSAMESSPFKVTYLKRLKSFIDGGRENPAVFIGSGGVDSLGRILSQANSAADGSDFSTFRACEEALAVLDRLPLAADEASIALLSKPESIKPMLDVLQRGGAEARLHAMAILQRISAANPAVADDFHHDIDVFKSLLDLLSDETSKCLTSSSLDLLLMIVENSKMNRLKAIEAGAVRVLVELLPDAGRRRGEKALLLLKRLCECAEGRSAIADHGMGIAAVASRVVRASDVETKMGVRILWLVGSFLPTKKVVDEMMACGAVRKLLGLLHGDGSSATKEKALKMIRMHGDAWRQYPCFPCELRAVKY